MIMIMIKLDKFTIDFLTAYCKKKQVVIDENKNITDTLIMYSTETVDDQIMIKSYKICLNNSDSISTVFVVSKRFIKEKKPI